MTAQELEVMCDSVKMRGNCVAVKSMWTDCSGKD